MIENLYIPIYIKVNTYQVYLVCIGFFCALRGPPNQLILF